MNRQILSELSNTLAVVPAEKLKDRHFDNRFHGFHFIISNV